MEPAKEFHVFHQRHFRKTANIDEGRSAAEYPVIAAPYSQHNTPRNGQSCPLTDKPGLAADVFGSNHQRLSDRA
jgi:hypothetical protein